MQPSVTISMATYQGLDYLKNCSLPSILIQTHQNFEVLISNDGPDPEVQLLIESMNDPRFKYFDYPRKEYADKKEAWCVGGARGHNLNFKIAQGKYIADLDQDDLWAPDFLETKIKFLESNTNIDFVHSTCAFSSGMVYYGKQYDGSTTLNTIGHLTVLYRNKLKKYEFTETGHVPGDFLRWQQMYKDGVKMQYLPVIKSLYNQKDKSFDQLREIYKKLFGVEILKLGEP